MPMSKAELRKGLLLRRRSMDKNTKQKCDDLIHTKLVELVNREDPKSVLCYISTGIEAETVRFVQEMLSKGIAVYAPRCNGRNMLFIRISDLSQLKKGAYGIYEPTGAEEIRDFSGSLCIVPALSYDRGGYRLGYGGGFYDRFLKGYSGLSVGICYQDFLGHVPHEEHDIPVQMIITEKEIIHINDCGGKE